MFAEKMIQLMKKKKITKKQISADLGIGINQIKYWQDHQNTPSAEVVSKIADYLDVSVDFLLGKEETGASPSPLFTLTDGELALIQAYRSRPEMQAAVNRLLGIEDEERVSVYMAAHSADNRPDKIIAVSKKFIEQLENAPETDETLI